MLSATTACYMRATDAGIEELYRMSYIAPDYTWPDGVARCTPDAEQMCP